MEQAVKTVKSMLGKAMDLYNEPIVLLHNTSSEWMNCKLAILYSSYDHSPVRIFQNTIPFTVTTGRIALLSSAETKVS